MNAWVKGVAGVGLAGLGAVAAGAVVERRVVKARRLGARDVDDLTALSAPAREVLTADGVVLHAEVDEQAPYATSAPREPGPTLVFVHGYALNLHCWHFQRRALRGRHRMVFYDQRSHGRSGRSDREHATIDQLGDDLMRVLDTMVPVPEGEDDPGVVLVGHSMGGMSIMAFAEQYPETFDARVRGVALVATTAGGLKPARILSPLIPDVLGGFFAPRVIAALASAPELIDSARSKGSNLGFLVADRFAFGGEAPAAHVELLDQMLAGTPTEVLAEFFDTFATLDKFAVLDRFGTVPTTVLCGTKDRITSIGHSRKMAARIEGSRLVEVEGAGHMVLFEDPELIEAEIERLVRTGEEVAR
ncbi:lipase [Marmoricola endophyticus]|uniref:Lipase n=1 Tax=Marmoricola endophyticus TaxID=2040280 RepID=A0A917F2Q6_9ACTN|nr:alpha/beta hydrolase [Marmoricola endophyticus]GGF42423.1 lipase [Marmoricola endophyticus]